MRQDNTPQVHPAKAPKLAQKILSLMFSQPLFPSAAHEALHAGFWPM
jgi:hypothetical protein